MLVDVRRVEGHARHGVQPQESEEVRVGGGLGHLDEPAQVHLQVLPPLLDEAGGRLVREGREALAWGYRGVVVASSDESMGLWMVAGVSTRTTHAPGKGGRLLRRWLPAKALRTSRSSLSNCHPMSCREG